jgi:hypothetical protein
LAKVNGAGGGRPKKLNVLYGSRHILSTRFGCLAADAKLYPVFARVVGCAPGTGFSKVRLDSLSDGISPLIAAVGLRLVLITPHLNRATICVIGRCR